MSPSARKSSPPAALCLALAALSLLACQLVSPRAATPAPRRATATPARGQPTADNPNTVDSTPAPSRSFSVGPAALSFLAPVQPANGVQLDESQLPFLLLFPELHDAPPPIGSKPARASPTA